MTFSGWVATLAGWYVTEIGRQPFIVYGLLRTADVVASHGATIVAATLAPGWCSTPACWWPMWRLKHMAENPTAHAPEGQVRARAPRPRA
jgi:cytochrome d ubiquinol oxidase subunit I